MEGAAGSKGMVYEARDHVEQWEREWTLFSSQLFGCVRQRGQLSQLTVTRRGCQRSSGPPWGHGRRHSTRCTPLPQLRLLNLDFPGFSATGQQCPGRASIPPATLQSCLERNTCAWQGSRGGKWRYLLLWALETCKSFGGVLGEGFEAVLIWPASSGVQGLPPLPASLQLVLVGATLYLLFMSTTANGRWLPSRWYRCNKPRAPAPRRESHHWHKPLFCWAAEQESGKVSCLTVVIAGWLTGQQFCPSSPRRCQARADLLWIREASHATLPATLPAWHWNHHAETVVRYHCESAQGVRGCHGVPCPHAQGWTTSRTVPPTAACREPSDGLTNRRLKSSCPCASPVAALRRATGVTCGVVTAPRSCLVWAITVMPQDKAGLLALGKRRQVRPVLQRDLSSYKGNCSTKRWMFLVPVGAPVISGAFWGHLVSIHPIALSGSE